jgi:N-acetylglucosaminyldiphosphoundecaprenol N-acetyl-beta-D-mannosaminyltransferase
MATERKIYDKFRIFGIPISYCDTKQALEFVGKSIKNKETNSIFTPCLESLALYNTNDVFADASDNVDLSIVDGITLVIMSKFTKYPLHERITGATFVVEIIKEFNETAKFFVVGSKPENLDIAFAKLHKDFPNMKGIEYYSPPFYKGSFPQEEVDIVIKKINESNANVVFFALGAPKQEMLIQAVKQHVKANILMSCGGTFEFIGGVVQRAPRRIQKMGLEWAFRIYSEPNRMIKRYAWQAKVFFIVVFKSIFGIKRKKLPSLNNNS